MRRISALSIFLLLACSASGTTSGNLPDVAAPGDVAKNDVLLTDAPTDAPDVSIDAPEVGADAADASIDAPEVASDAPDSSMDAPEVASDAPDSSIDAPEVASDALDASIDAPEVAADAPPACRTSADCPTGAICSALLRNCVECTVDGECPTARPVCRGGACVARVVCESSRMCPGGVCDTAAQSCVPCAADVDCNTGERCVTHTCVANTPCRSSVQCSALNMVCDTAAGRCVDCAADVDCGAGAYCNAQGLCHPRVCVPSSATCVDAMTVRTCDARGSMTTTMMCPTGQSCMAGRCVMRVCTPGSMECVGTGNVRRCAADGFGFEAMTPCATGQVCVAGACTTLVCMPDAPSGCADATSARVCAADGLGYRNVPCVARANAPAACVGSACALVCATGFANCDGVESTGCEANLRTSNANCGACGRACGAAEICSAGTCVSGMCPSSCATNANCLSCLAPGDTGNYCCISGLCLYTTSACGAPTDAGTTDVGPTDSGTTPDSGSTCGGDGQPCCSGSCTGSNVCVSGTCRACRGNLCGTGATAYCTMVGSFDPRNCGGCGVGCPAVEGAYCNFGMCYAQPSPRCSGGNTECASSDASSRGCVNVLTSASNCGGCNRACPSGTACVNGACGTASCASGLTRCTVGTTAVCVDTQAHRDHCGFCGNACPAGQRCLSGACAAARALCPVGQFDVAPGEVNPTCVDLQTNRSHCGVIRNVCPTGMNCVRGVCAP